MTAYTVFAVIPFAMTTELMCRSMFKVFGINRDHIFRNGAEIFPSSTG
jgi:hypothetical protein